jgi:hypothetical protein
MESGWSSRSSRNRFFGYHSMMTTGNPSFYGYINISLVQSSLAVSLTMFSMGPVPDKRTGRCLGPEGNGVSLGEGG